MFKCNLTGAKYTYEAMNLLDLRNKVVLQFGLKPWDIYAGYSEKSEINYKAKQVDVSPINTPWKVQLATNIGKRINKRDVRLQQDIDTLTAERDRLDASIIAIAKDKTGKELSSYEEYRQTFGFNLGIPTHILNTRNDIIRALDNIHYGSNGRKYAVEITSDDLNLFEDESLFVATTCYGESAVTTAETLLHKFDYRQMVCILDYCERNQLSEDEKLRAFKVDTSQEYAVHIDTFKGKDYPELIKQKSYFDDYEYGLYKRVPHEEIYNYILTELNSYAERVVQVDKDIYYQQVDITPITINITAEGKIELIDGYKRLLYVNNMELLNVEAPIKVFKELSDEDFIRLLYSANAWKTVNTGWHATPFHDRGYIFALRQRFGIRFEDYFHDTWKDIDLLELLQIYDSPSNYCLYNKYLVEDIKAVVHLDTIEMEFFKDENNEIYHRVIKTSIRILGETRRNNLDKEQKSIDFNYFLGQVLSDKAFTKKLASKEKLSVGGHIDNFIAEHVTPVLKQAMLSTLLDNN